MILFLVKSTYFTPFLSMQLIFFDLELKLISKISAESKHDMLSYIPALDSEKNFNSY